MVLFQVAGFFPQEHRTFVTILCIPFYHTVLVICGPEVADNSCLFVGLLIIWNISTKNMALMI